MSDNNNNNNSVPDMNLPQLIETFEQNVILNKFPKPKQSKILQWTEWIVLTIIGSNLGKRCKMLDVAQFATMLAKKNGTPIALGQHINSMESRLKFAESIFQKTGIPIQLQKYPTSRAVFLVFGQGGDHGSQAQAATTETMISQFEANSNNNNNNAASDSSLNLNLHFVPSSIDVELINATKQVAQCNVDELKEVTSSNSNSELIDATTQNLASFNAYTQAIQNSSEVISPGKKRQRMATSESDSAESAEPSKESESSSGNNTLHTKHLSQPQSTSNYKEERLAMHRDFIRYLSLQSIQLPMEAIGNNSAANQLHADQIRDIRLQLHHHTHCITQIMMEKTQK